MVGRQYIDGSFGPADEIPFYKGFIGRLFCKHKYKIIKWHFTHRASGHQSRYIEGFKQCPLCGKVRYFWVERGSMLEKKIMKECFNKQW